MVRVGLPAPTFACTAVIDGRALPLTWGGVHENKTLLLLFEVLDGSGPSPPYLAALAVALRTLDRPAKLAVVCRHPLAEVLTWALRRRAQGGPGTRACPLIVDAEDRLAELYDLRPANGLSLRGHFLIDAEGIVRQMTLSRLSLAASVDDLVRGIQACRPEAERGPWN